MSLTNKDKVRIFLNQQHSAYIAVGSLTDLATMADMGKIEFYQALYRLQMAGELKIESEKLNGANRPQVTGIRIIKLSSTSSIAEGEIRKASKPVAIKKEKVELSKLPNLENYLTQKSVLDDISKKLVDSGFAPDTITVNFEENPYAEEGIRLLDLLERATDVINGLTQENANLKNENETYEAIVKQTKPQGVDIPTPADE